MKPLIDPGHGGQSGGCHGVDERGVVHHEDGLSLAISKRLTSLLANERPKIHASVTRSDDVAVGLDARAEMSSAHDLTISIHCDSGSPYDSGMTCYVWGGNPRTPKIAMAIAAACPEPLKPCQIVVLPDPRYPRATALAGMFPRDHILVEACFLTSRDYLAYITGPEGQGAVAWAILQGIRKADTIYKETKP